MKKSTLFLIILIAIFFTSTLVLIYLNYLKPQSIPTPTTGTIPTETPTLDSTTDWKTYTSSDFGFSIDYPQDLQIQNFMNDQYNRTVSFKGSDIYFSITLRKTDSSFNLDKYYFMDSLSVRTTTMSGQKANVYEMPNGYCDGPGCSQPYIAIVTEHNNDVYSISFFGDSKLSSLESQILSTFKFTDITSSIPVDWKTYTNSTYNLSFKYPSDYKVTILNEAINLQKNSTRALLYISKFSNPNTLDISQWFDGQPKEDIQPIKDAHIMTNIIVGGQKALMFTKTKPETGYKDFMIIVGSKTNVYYLNFGPLDSEVDTSTQILSTFKFL